MKKVKFIAILSALAAAICLYFFLNTASQPKETPKATVVVAAADIAENSVIKAEMLRSVAVPAESVLPGAVSNAASIVGKITNSQILSGEQILSRRLVETVSEQSGGSLSYAVSAGMRAVTIPVSETSGLAGLLRPGNRVDVVTLYEATLTEKGQTVNGETASRSTGKMTAQLLLQNIEILAVSNVMDKKGSSKAYTSVTLEVTPDQALELSLAENSATVSLLLRSPIDTAEVETKSVTTDVLH